MPILDDQLELDRCPHCRVDKPNLPFRQALQTQAHSGGIKRFWRMYVCGRCGGVVTASARNEREEILDLFPKSTDVDSSIPEKPRTLLMQASQSLHAPAGAIMLCASAIDAMLKAKERRKSV